ncbi:mucoidy inhibitor MuiA family protein [Dactylosporangium sp. AC04546]|uniref:mucoidy inhibitor MuiA family protein n=1 Tax=Dactylosporangium sp. AC04546 TaxID=2862460 RepID=UPI001EDE33BD|nr:mucoidy inhibitor MuiA family protein [Dactylosporangium sp. AC04546]WVK81365.1 mucoidy inhibitor MuiA family protein [Dactylosporangium sp. AC04546]
MPNTIDAAVVAVTVYPTQARVTRRGRVTLDAGEQVVEVGPLPLSLDGDSIRVSGRGPATVLGVDVVLRRQERPGDATVAAVREERDRVADESVEIDDAETVLRQRQTFLTTLGERASGAWARALATGAAPADSVTSFTTTLGGELTEVLTALRELRQRRTRVAERLAALDRRLADLSGKREPDGRYAVVALTVSAPGEVELDVSYQVPEAGWRSTYDVRLVGETLELTWFGLVEQRTGEDWPECELALSTARPSGVVAIPELDPWYLDLLAPPPPPQPYGAYGGGGYPAPAPMMAAPGGPPPRAAAMAASMDLAAPVELEVAQAKVEEGPIAATYRPARAVAVPADGTTARATVAVFELAARLDHVSAPARSTDVHVRAVVTNSSQHTLPPGKASVFHEADFVSRTALSTWAPGEELELALGLDDRVRVERELVRRTATKATLGSSRRREVEYRTTIGNFTGRPVRITVLDQLPVSRHDGIAVRETALEPQPAERTDLGVVTWRMQLAEGQSATLRLGYRVETAKGIEMSGWRE